MRIFIADDELEEINKWKMVLSKTNHQIIGKGRSQRDIFVSLNQLAEAKNLPDCIIIDMKFEGNYRYGLDILKELRKEVRFEKIKVVVSSRHDDTNVIREIITKSWASAYISKHNRQKILPALEKISRNEEYWDEISLPVRLSIDRLIRIRAETKFKKILYQLLPKKEKEKINITPRYQGMGQQHIQFLKNNYANHRLNIPIPLSLDEFLQEARQMEIYGFTPTQWIIFKEIAKGRTTKKVVANCNTTQNNVNAQVPLILEMFGYNQGHGNWSVLLIEAMKMHLPDIDHFIEQECSIYIKGE